MTTTRRPRIGLIDRDSGRQSTAVELLDKDGNLIGYATQVGGAPVWYPYDTFTPLAEVPEPRMAEPQGFLDSVVSTSVVSTGKSHMYVRMSGGLWLCVYDDGSTGMPYKWSELLDPRPTTPTERATGIVGGEDQ